MSFNPCITCGACCAFFRVSFYWAEIDEATPGGVPGKLTEKLTPFRAVMKGTNAANPRCVALDGKIGDKVGCSIYPNRPHACREVMPSYHDGRTRSDQCDKARAAWYLPLLKPEDWIEHQR